MSDKPMADKPTVTTAQIVATHEPERFPEYWIVQWFEGDRFERMSQLSLDEAKAYIAKNLRGHRARIIRVPAEGEAVGVTRTVSDDELLTAAFDSEAGPDELDSEEYRAFKRGARWMQNQMTGGGG